MTDHIPDFDTRDATLPSTQLDAIGIVAELAAAQPRRLGCGWSFETLDPNHADPNKREFVHCVKCHRPYIAKYVAKPAARCTNPRCDSVVFEPLVVSPPAPLIVEQRIPVDSTEGPLTSLDDPGLGMNTGSVFVFNRETQGIICRNNSSKSLRLPRVSTPIWLDARWRHVEMLSTGATGDAVTWTLKQPVAPSTGYLLHSGQHVALALTASHLRPIRALRYLRLFPDREPIVVSDQESAVFHLLWGLIAILVAVHLMIIDQGHLAAGISFGAVITAVYAAVPRLLTAPVDFMIHSFMPDAKWTSADIFGLDDCVSYATARAVLGGVLIFLGTTLVSVYLATVAVPTGWWRAAYSLLAMASTNYLVAVHGFNPVKEAWHRISRNASSSGRSPGHHRS